MGALKLTARAIESLKATAVRDGRDVFGWDTEVRGFGVKATAKGAVSYIVQKSIGGRTGKRKRIVIGHYPAKPLDAARKDAGKAVSDVQSGVDIITERKQRRQTIRDNLNTELEATIDLYLARKSDPDSRYWSEVSRLLKTQVVPTLGPKLPVAAISKASVRSLIEAKEETHPGAARNMFAALRPFFKWCVERDLITSSPMDTLSSPDVIASRDRKLSETELRVFWQATEQMPYPFGPFYQLLLLTAQRREEVAAMRWAEVDLGKGEWIIPKERTKNGKEHLVHLSPQAVEIFKKVRADQDGGLVFTTTGETPISGYSNAKEKLDRLCARIAEESYAEFLPQIFQTEWRVHDLRRTAASGMAELGFQPHIVERVLNHISGAQGGLVGVYQRFDYAEERKRALHVWAKHVEQMFLGEPFANVVSFKGETT